MPPGCTQVGIPTWNTPNYSTWVHPGASFCSLDGNATWVHPGGYTHVEYPKLFHLGAPRCIVLQSRRKCHLGAPRWVYPRGIPQTIPPGCTQVAFPSRLQNDATWVHPGGTKFRILDGGHPGGTLNYTPSRTGLI